MTDNRIPTSEPSDADVLLEAVRAGLANVHTELPGVVMSFDASTKLATLSLVLIGST